MINIDKRLSVCAEMIDGHGVVCDVGTDHAYLPVYLIEQGICNRAIASDINEGPLSFAKQTLKKYGYEEKIELVKSDGLNNVPEKDVSDVVIAGMGGETISEILGKTDWIKKGINLVLQPMTRAGHLRKWLYNNGFEIISEKAVIQDRFLYTVIRAVYTGFCFKIGKVAEIVGRVDLYAEEGKKYCENQLSKINNIAIGMTKAGKLEEAKKYNRISKQIKTMMEGKMNLVSDIYIYIDNLSPFVTQTKWDNSGLIVGSMNRKVSRVLVSLDITNEVAHEAAEIGAELVISHHPVIFHPLHTLSDNEPSYILAKNGISAICVHTPFDMAENGMNDILTNLSGFEKVDGILEVVGESEKKYGFGTIGTIKESISAKQLAEKMKNVLGCTVVKYTDSGEKIKRVAFCTGSGGDLIDEALIHGADAYVTSEVKHDQWLYAKRKGISVMDCGHFHTENIGMINLCKRLTADFPNIEFVMSEVNKDPVNYVL